MRQLRAVHDTAVRRDECVPPTNPVIAVTLNRLRRRREHLDLSVGTLHRPRPEGGVHRLDLEVLLNHALPAADDVTQGYIRPSLDHLRASVERVGEFLVERARRG